MSKELFYAAFAVYLRDEGYDVVRVTDVREEHRSGGYCETCYYEYTEVEVTYLDSEGVERMYAYYGSFGELIASL